MGKVREMHKRGFDPALAALLVVSERADGSQIILDGQTRNECAKLSGVQTLWAIIWSELDLGDEAWLFAYLNKKSNPPAIYSFRGRVNANEQIPNDIINTLYANGWELSETGAGGDGKFLAVVTAERIYCGKGDYAWKRQGVHVPGPELFAQTITTVTEAWGHNRDAVDNAIIGGVAAFLVRWWDDIDDDRLVRVLKQHKPIEIKAHGRLTRRTTGLSAILSQSWGIHQLYNKGLRDNKLSPYIL